ncbi:MAG TPA: hypothetical protein VHD63_11125 [Ktedonobacteraceae bacterium]|nr:hypothetical protein [Ktedonobacteraceae bacterium]
MPLDPRKILHIQQVTNATFANRQRTVVLVILNSGVYSYVTLLAILRPLQVLNPQVAENASSDPLRFPDMLMQAPLDTDLTGVVYVADTATPTATAVAGAAKYEILEALLAGMAPAGSHLHVLLRRLR